MSYWRLRSRVEHHKALVNVRSKKVPKELIELETQIKQMQAEIAAMKTKNVPESIIAEKSLDLGVLKIRYKTAIKKFDDGDAN
ncbi:unnamed protein product [marine sediment metagenome]|uniref:Uncharacterized protein n=1 Tax=marine sediment metagenome TaxID=412755 RepID=X1ARV2_9ZZZZ